MWNGWAIAFNVAALYLVHFTDMSNVVWVPIGISGGLKNLIMIIIVSIIIITLSIYYLQVQFKKDEMAACNNL